MAYRFDMTRKMNSMLLAAVLILALIVPACMTLACMEGPMSGSASMGGMSIADCLDAGVSHDGLLALGASTLTTTVLLVALLGFMLSVGLSAPPTRAGRVLSSRATGPPPPLDPRGERLLI